MVWKCLWSCFFILLGTKPAQHLNRCCLVASSLIPVPRCGKQNQKGKKRPSAFFWERSSFWHTAWTGTCLVLRLHRRELSRTTRSRQCSFQLQPSETQLAVLAGKVQPEADMHNANPDVCFALLCSAQLCTALCFTSYLAVLQWPLLLWLCFLPYLWCRLQILCRYSEQ